MHCKKEWEWIHTLSACIRKLLLFSRFIYKSCMDSYIMVNYLYQYAIQGKIHSRWIIFEGTCIQVWKPERLYLGCKKDLTSHNHNALQERTRMNPYSACIRKLLLLRYLYKYAMLGVRHSRMDHIWRYNKTIPTNRKERIYPIEAKLDDELFPSGENWSRTN